MSCPSHTAGRNVHVPASMTEHGFSSYLGPLPAIHICGFLSVWLLWLEGVGQSCPPSCLPQRSDNLPWEWAPSLNVFIVTLPYSLVSITKPFQLDLQPEATLRNAAKAQTFFWNFLWVELMVASLVSGCVRQSPVADSGPESAVLSWESLLESDSLPVIPADLYCRLSITIYGAPQGLCSQPVMGGWLQPWLGLEGRLLNSGSNCLGLLVAASWMGRVLHPLLMLLSLVSAWVLLLLWPSGVLPG